MGEFKSRAEIISGTAVIATPFPLIGHDSPPSTYQDNGRLMKQSIIHLLAKQEQSLRRKEQGV